MSISLSGTLADNKHMSERKSIEIAAAAFIENGRLWAAQRGYGEFRDGWEFPGGKLEKSETPEEALRREIREELNAEIEIGKPLPVIHYSYPGFDLTMHVFICSFRKGERPVLLEHESARWLGLHEIFTVDWLPANYPAVREIEAMLNG